MPPLSLRSALSVTGCAVALLGTFLPWLRTGERVRSSYDLSSIARQLQVASSTGERLAITLWPVVPFCLLSAAVLLVMRCSSGARVFALGVSVYVGAVAIIVWRTPLDTGPGVPITVGGAALFAVGALARQAVCNER